MYSKDWVFQQYIRELANGKLSFSSSLEHKKTHKDKKVDIYTKGAYEIYNTGSNAITNG